MRMIQSVSVALATPMQAEISLFNAPHFPEAPLSEGCPLHLLSPHFLRICAPQPSTPIVRHHAPCFSHFDSSNTSSSSSSSSPAATSSSNNRRSPIFGALSSPKVNTAISSVSTSTPTTASTSSPASCASGIPTSSCLSSPCIFSEASPQFSSILNRLPCSENATGLGISSLLSQSLEEARIVRDIQSFPQPSEISCEAEKSLHSIFSPSSSSSSAMFYPHFSAYYEDLSITHDATEENSLPDGIESTLQSARRVEDCESRWRMKSKEQLPFNEDEEIINIMQQIANLQKKKRKKTKAKQNEDWMNVSEKHEEKVIIGGLYNSMIPEVVEEERVVSEEDEQMNSKEVNERNVIQ
ncbi:uncharacterized protein MONOS_8950 [Monocercomonoides exilis]|uniref:uncharacterized protein n=1 Tax=Monocercomonoides exilis TaxID=2049356 RepID=UPI00355A54DE|nr:hypothetical protein MONOS_8950 [Monocercomonoides exilis]|eukprot:MONOS_8950.1-p1 / transcript=MONOS_8950.1 / gene=MONOS_8950 / organism=Monocercomonoides_exilis_PA203 / gene_product=unspecified product / transcript_product=unspecified product / location=Mono_scaffold00353:6205-7266(-) / protein_length=354 / sequence_SO=supercontig / SO=protein_coding / is_pseudo=false